MAGEAGLQDDRQAFLDFRARYQQAFRPFAPIDLPDFFKGRHQDVRLLTSELETPGRQVAIHDERGVGKTSLAMLAYFFTNYSDEATYFVRCDKDSVCESIFGGFLVSAGKWFVPDMLETASSQDAGLRGGPPTVSSKRGSRSKHLAMASARSVGPAMLPVATPPNAIVFGSGQVRMSDMVKSGLVLNFAGVVLVSLCMYLIVLPLLGRSPELLAWAK